MAIKMRVLHYTNKGKLMSAADHIRAEYDLAVNAVDTIPPAYSCNNERIVILVLSVKADADDTLRRFVLELTKARAQNVAIITDGKEAGAEKVKGYLKKAGTNVIEDVHYMKVGLFSGKNLTDDEKSALSAWTKKVVESLA